MPNFTPATSNTQCVAPVLRPLFIQFEGQEQPCFMVADQESMDFQLWYEFEVQDNGAMPVPYKDLLSLYEDFEEAQYKAEFEAFIDARESERYYTTSEPSDAQYVDYYGDIPF